MVPVLAVLAAVYLMLNLPAATWLRFLIWMALGVVVYFVHGRRSSRLATDPEYARSSAADGDNQPARSADHS